MKLAIIGGRTFVDYALMCKSIDTFCKDQKVTLVISGGAKGADTLAEKWALEHNIDTLILKPDWTIGKRAGLERNTDIVNEATHLIAFVMPESKGTWDSIKKAREKGIPTKVIEKNNNQRLLDSWFC